MSQLAAVDISDSDRFELAEVLKEESESNSAPRPLEDILQETCDDVFDPMSQRSCYELLSAYIARPTATIVSKTDIPPARIAVPAFRITPASPHTAWAAGPFSASNRTQPIPPRPFCGGTVTPRWAPWLDGAPCWEIEHTDIERAVAVECPIEMGGYDSLEQLQRVWNTRRSDSAVGALFGDAFDAEA